MLAYLHMGKIIFNNIKIVLTPMCPICRMAPEFTFLIGRLGLKFVNF